MLSMAEAALLLARINAHHGNAQVEDLQVQVFHDELRADMTMKDAVEAIRRFYANNSTGRWMGSGDVNAGVKKLRAERQPSDETIYQLTKGTNLNGNIHYLQALRMGVSGGLSLTEAHENAQNTVKQIAPKREAPQRQVDWRNVGRGVK